MHVVDEESARLDWVHTEGIAFALDQGPVEEQFKVLVSDGGVQSS